MQFLIHCHVPPISRGPLMRQKTSTPRRCYVNQYSQLTDAVLEAATLLPVIPSDLAPRLDALKARRDQEPPRDPEDELAAALRSATEAVLNGHARAE